MILISHRGNIDGPCSAKENSPSYIIEAVNQGFNVEIDVWYKDKKVYLGHDEPRNEVGLEFLKNDKFWCHAKNLQALDYMIEHGIHCFWHQEDDYTLTSQGFIWTYPGKPLCTKSVIVIKDLETTKKLKDSNISGICSDYVGDINKAEQ